MRTILVTGATGFVGGHALRYLAGIGNIRLIAACRDPERLPADFKGETRIGDLRDPAYLAHLLDEVDVVVNAMAWTSLWGHARQSRHLFLKPTLALIDRFLASKARQFVNVSTTSAAAPHDAADAMSPGTERRFWPHLGNVIAIENDLRARARGDKTVINLRLGIFVGENYALGLLPILVPRLKTHLVPWVAGGRTELPLIDGRDIGQALGLAALHQGLRGYHAFNVVGPEIPTVRQVIEYLHQAHGYPRPHFNVPFSAAYAFGWLMEKLDLLLPWEPLIVRSVVHLLENTGASNKKVSALLGYRPRHDWRDAIDLQLLEMQRKQVHAMSMARPIG